METYGAKPLTALISGRALDPLAEWLNLRAEELSSHGSCAGSEYLDGPKGRLLG